MINVLKTRIVTTLPDGSVTKEVKNTVYNNQVPNAVAFDVLAFKAAGAQLTARSGPTDAAYISIALVDSNGDESVLMEQESGKRQINESPEARKFVRFILANCRSK